MEQNWTTIIKPKNKLMDLKLKEIWQYRDLIMMFVKRDFKTLYKQTVLGPLWILITPLLTTFMQVSMLQTWQVHGRVLYLVLQA